VPKKPKKVEVSLREYAYKIAQEIMKQYTFATLNGSDELLVYEDGVYREGGEFVVKAYVQKSAMLPMLGVNLVNEVIGNIKRSTYVSPSRFYEPSPYLVVQNGLLNTETGELTPHTPEFYSLSKLPVKFDPTKDCPMFKKFLAEVLYPEDIPVVQEWIGYCLHRGYPAQAAMLFVGDGNNGKSTLISTIQALLGKDNVSAVSLQELETNRFAKADLFGKLANLYADLPDTALKSVGTFKMLTGGDPIRGERKFQNSFVFVNHAKLTFSCNVVPEVYEDTIAFFRRWIIIQFPHTFDGEKADKSLLTKLTTPDELSGILNWALEGLARLRNNGWVFSNSKSTEEIRLDYIRRSSPMKAFILDAVTVNPKGKVAKQDLFQAFVKYCEKMKLSAVTSNTFFQNLPLYFAKISLETTREDVDRDGKREYCFRGIELRPEETWGKSIETDEAADIKIEKPLDMVDKVDKKPEEPANFVQDVQDVEGSSYFNIARASGTINRVSQEIEPQTKSVTSVTKPSQSDQAYASPKHTLVPCPYCKCRFNSERDLESHLTAIHPEERGNSHD
jgi:putative DNA primase/helicase